MALNNVLSVKSLPQNSLLALIFLFPVLAATVRHGGTAIFLLLMLAGLVWGWKGLQYLTADEKKVIWGLLIFFAVVVLSLVNTSDYSTAWKKFERFLRIIAIIPIYLLLVRLDVDFYKALLAGLVASAFAMLAKGLHDLFIVGKPFMEGAYYTTLFGYVSVLNFYMLLAVLLTDKPGRARQILYSVAIIILLSCAVLSTSRASWLGAIAIFVFLLALFILTRKLHVSWKTVTISSVILLLAIGFNYERVTKRIDIGVQDIQNYDPNQVATSSLGIRLSLWRDSLSLFKASPLLGTGVGDFDHDRNIMIEKGLTQATPSYGHAHNLFLHSLATTGIIGLVALVLGLFVIPFRYFLKNFRAASNNESRYFSMVGMIVLIGFVFFGVGEVWLARNPTTNVFAFLVAISMAGVTILRRRENDSN